MNEAVETLKKYLSNEINTVHYHGNDSLVSRFCDVLYYGKTVECDAPDMYIKIDNEIWILEHFEFDCYKANRKGSTYKREKNRIDRAESELEPSEKGVVFHDTIKADSSYVNYIDNVTRSFRSHYEKVEQYKKNLLEEKIADDKTDFKIIFLVDDVSPLGSSYVDERGIWRPIVLSHSKKFLQLLEESPLVDGVLSVSCGNSEKYIWFIDRRQINEYYNNVEDYDSCKFMDFKPHVVGVKIAIPDELIKGSLEEKE